MGSFKLKPQAAPREKQRYVMANLVYGEMYLSLWLNNHIKTLMDPTNLPAVKDKYHLEYVIFTDEETFRVMSIQPAFNVLNRICEVNVVKMNWPTDSDKFGSRYHLLCQMFHQVLPVALQNKGWMSLFVADLVFAKHAIPRILKRLENGHDAVLMVPIRGTVDSLGMDFAKLEEAPTDMELFKMCYEHLHHLWVAAHWDAPLFSKFPYSMVWNSGSGLLTHNFGITPIVFKPNEAMRGVQGVIDSDVPAFCERPYWATDWLNAPIAGIEPLSNGHYPPFLQHRASTDFVIEWSKKGTQPVQALNLDKPLYYPSKAIFNNEVLAGEAAAIAQEIQGKLGAPQTP